MFVTRHTVEDLDHLDPAPAGALRLEHERLQLSTVQGFRAGAIASTHWKSAAVHGAHPKRSSS
jgi:hypothetical protein